MNTMGMQCFNNLGPFVRSGSLLSSSNYKERFNKLARKVFIGPPDLYASKSMRRVFLLDKIFMPSLGQLSFQQITT